MAAIVADDFGWVNLPKPHSSLVPVKQFNPVKTVRYETHWFASIEFTEVTDSLIIEAEKVTAGVKTNHLVTVTLPIVALIVTLLFGFGSMYVSLNASIESQRLETKADIIRLTEIMGTRFDKNDARLETVSNKLDNVSSSLQTEVTNLRVRQAQIERTQ